MPEIPLTFARTQVPSPGGAPQMGQKLSIHAYDAIYEQERRDIAGTARAITGATQQITKTALDFLDKQKAKEDKINFLQYQDKMNDAFNTYTEEYLQNPEFEDWGKDYQKRMPELSKVIMDELKMSSQAKEMGQQWFLQQGMNWKRQISRDYSSARMNHFDNGATFLLDKAVENGDASSALVMAELRAENSPARAASLDADKKQIKERVWWNNEVRELGNDPFNYEMPKENEIVGGKKALDALKMERDKLFQEEKKHLNERKQEMFAELDDDLKNGILTLNTLDEYYEKPDKWGLPYLNKSQYDAYKDDMGQDDRDEDENKLAVLMDDIYYYNSNNDLDKTKWTDIQSRKHEFGWKARNQIDIQIDKATKVRKSNLKFSDIQKADRRRLFGDLVQGFFSEDEAKKYGIYKTKVQSLFGIDYLWRDKLIPAAGKQYAAISNIEKEFDSWTMKNPEWTMEEGQSKIKEIAKPYAKAEYKEDLERGEKRQPEITPEKAAEAEAWARANPKDPRAQAILKRLGK